MGDKPKIGIVVVAYNAATTLTGVLDRIPADFRPRISDVLVFDDHSTDDTYDVGLAYQADSTDLPITMIRHPRNLGYGGNQKAAYRLAYERGLDIVVLLHADGQYAPEAMPEIVAPLEAGECDAVMGSRMMERGAARRGGMPAYKYLGNRVLTAFENRMLSTSLTEFHSGYRAFRVEVLASLPLERNADGFAFDTQVIIQLHDAGYRIVEVPIPTYYGDEICYVNGVRYAAEISLEVARYRMARLGVGSGPACLPSALDPPEPYELKPSEGSSHSTLIQWLGERAPSRLLDLGCSSGLLAQQARKLGHKVVGVDVEQHEEVERRVDQFFRADLDRGIPDEVGEDFDVALAADVLEHVREPRALLREMGHRLNQHGVIYACVPNFGHWYPRGRAALGLFDYDPRGILDAGHLRFFTRRSFERLVRSEGFTIRRRHAIGLPLDVFGKAIGNGGLLNFLGSIDRLAVRLRPQLFAYQLCYELVPTKSTAFTQDAEDAR